MAGNPIRWGSKNGISFETAMEKGRIIQERVEAGELFTDVWRDHCASKQQGQRMAHFYKSCAAIIDSCGEDALRRIFRADRLSQKMVVWFSLQAGSVQSRLLGLSDAELLAAMRKGGAKMNVSGQAKTYRCRDTEDMKHARKSLVLVAARLKKNGRCVESVRKLKLAGTLLDDAIASYEPEEV